MTKKNILGKAATYLLTILSVALILLIVSCKGEESRPSTERAAQDISTYSPDSVFIEVKKKLEENPNDADAWFHLGDLYERNGQYPEAIDAYKKVIALKPAMGYAYFKMGTDYSQLNKPAEAVAALKKAIQYMPKYAAAYNNLAVAYGRLGKLNEEIDNLTKAIRLRPRYATARFNLGVAYLKAKNKKAALKEYESLKEIDMSIADELMKKIRSGSGSSGKTVKP